MSYSFPAKMTVLDVPISVVNMESATELVTQWAKQSELRQVFLRDVHGIMRAVDDRDLLELHSDADLVLPDGMPLTWIGRFRGYGGAIGRTPGADVVDSVCANSVQFGLSHYFYGGKPGVAEAMATQLLKRHPGLKIAGVFSPPMRDQVTHQPMSDSELREIMSINESDADFIWVGLSTPKQEIWMQRASNHLNKGVVFGVGAAFDFHAGAVKRAPSWMRNYGFEWLHRLVSEPKRLWRRYVIIAPRFVYSLAFASRRQKLAKDT